MLVGASMLEGATNQTKQIWQEQSYFINCPSDSSNPGVPGKFTQMLKGKDPQMTPGVISPP